MLAYFNRHGVQVRGGGGKGEREGGEWRNEKHKEVSERDISFFHTMCYCKIFISSAIPPSLQPFVFLLHHCQCALAEVVQVASSPLDPVSILDPSLQISFSNCGPAECSCGNLRAFCCSSEPPKPIKNEHV